MTAIDTYGIHDTDACAAGRFEACGEHRGPDTDGPCTDCGWLAAEHTAGLAEVIVVRRRPVAAPLRRAS